MTTPPRYAGTSIVELPTFSGPHGRAWRIELAPPGQRSRPDYDATIDMFLVQAHGAHPLWDHWIISAIHLRPIDGVRPAVIRQPGATHEFMILALNPEHPLPALRVDDGWQLHYLTPIDVNEQFTTADDAIAQQILELAVRAIVDGHASPDQDWRRWWKQALPTTAAHFADGTHGVDRA